MYIQVRESAFASIKVLLLKKYLNTSRIEEFVCPTSVQLLNLEGLPEDVVRERHPDAFVVRINVNPSNIQIKKKHIKTKVVHRSHKHDRVPNLIDSLLYECAFERFFFSPNL